MCWLDASTTVMGRLTPDAFRGFRCYGDPYGDVVGCDDWIIGDKVMMVGCCLIKEIVFVVLQRFNEQLVVNQESSRQCSYPRHHT